MYTINKQTLLFGQFIGRPANPVITSQFGVSHTRTGPAEEKVESLCHDVTGWTVLYYVWDPVGMVPISHLKRILHKTKLRLILLELTSKI